MADRFVANTLTSWKMVELLDKFKSEEIDEDAFRALDLNFVKELIPKLGLQIKFWKKYCQFIQENKEESASASEVRKIRHPSTASTSKVCKEILAYYASSKALNDCMRSDLVKIVVNAELNGSAERKISPDRLLQLRDEMIELFPTEEKQTYYVPHIEFGKVKGKLWSEYWNILRNASTTFDKVARVDSVESAESAESSIDFTKINKIARAEDYLPNKKITDLEVFENYQITSLRNVKTKFGDRIKVDVGDTFSIFLPPRMVKILTDDEDRFRKMVHAADENRLQMRYLGGPYNQIELNCL